MEKRHVAVLVGNGLSIAFNPDLTLPKITDQVRRRILLGRDGDERVEEAMRELANAWLPAGDTSDEDFEKLVGAFGAEQQSLSRLQTLAELTKPDTGLAESIQEVIDFARELSDVGTSYVLDVIYDHSKSDYTSQQELIALLRAIRDSFDGHIAYGNLNYDTILMAGLLNLIEPVADLGDGRNTIVLGREGIPAYPLRTDRWDFPSRFSHRVQLLHLHGSLTYWKTEDGTQAGKIRREEVGDNKLFRKVRQGKTDLRPLVILNRERQKVDEVSAQPYKLAYEKFSESIAESEHWLVIGYSFRDVAVNDVLRTEFLSRKRKPKVFVVTYGKYPTRREVLRALGWGAEDGEAKWLKISRRGADGVQNRPMWHWFTKRKKSDAPGVGFV